MTKVNTKKMTTKGYAFITKKVAHKKVRAICKPNSRTAEKAL